MKEQFLFIIKLIVASTLLSILVKYGGRLLPISANNTLALTVVLLPSLLLGLFLWLRNVKSSSAS